FNVVLDELLVLVVVEGLLTLDELFSVVLDELLVLVVVEGLLTLDELFSVVLDELSVLDVLLGESVVSAVAEESSALTVFVDELLIVLVVV
ncbi:hypothetical protein OF389_12255, partial [Companilactobacillus farciminis]|nr:hypothetical protein [Companilactobacillus farciminis]